MKAFDTYTEARGYAQSRANALRHSFGIAGPTQYNHDCRIDKLPAHMLGWRVFLLPRKENRRGHELRCEVVDPL